MNTQYCQECGDLFRPTSPYDSCCQSCIEESYRKPYWRDEVKEGTWQPLTGIKHKDVKIALAEAQGGFFCAICGRRNVPLYIDHDHETGWVRGLLCKDCNYGLGWFRDNVVRLKAAIRYLAKNYSHKVLVKYFQPGKFGKPKPGVAWKGPQINATARRPSQRGRDKPWRNYSSKERG